MAETATAPAPAANPAPVTTPAPTTAPAAAPPATTAPATPAADPKAPVSILGPGNETPKTDAPKTQAPEKYSDFKLPEGLSVNKSAMDKFTPIFKDLGLSQENAQKLVDAQASFEQSVVEAQVAGLEKQNVEWLDTLKKGWGSEFDKHVGFAAKGIEGLGIKGLREWLHESGLSNNPLLVEAFAKIGAEFFSEAQPSTGRSDNGKGAEEKSTGSLMYPDMKQHPDGKYR